MFQDRQVGQIGDAVDRLAEIAVQIGHKAEQQSQLVAELHEQADDANAELLAVNDTIKDVLVLFKSFSNLCYTLFIFFCFTIEKTRGNESDI